MTAAALAPPPPAQPAGAAEAPEWARALLERQLWILGQLAEGGLEIARAVERQATGGRSGEDAPERAPEGVEAHIPMAYARVARAVRMTILLQSKLIGDLQTLQTKAAHESAHANSLRGTQRIGLMQDQKRRIGRIVSRIAWVDGREPAEIERLTRRGVEMLDYDDHFGDILTRPVSETIALICKDLGLEPDWPQLAEEAWAKAEIQSGAAGGPLAGVRPAPRRAAANDQVPLTPQAASP